MTGKRYVVGGCLVLALLVAATLLAASQHASVRDIVIMQALLVAQTVLSVAACKVVEMLGWMK